MFGLILFVEFLRLLFLRWNVTFKLDFFLQKNFFLCFYVFKEPIYLCICFFVFTNDLFKKFDRFVCFLVKCRGLILNVLLYLCLRANGPTLITDPSIAATLHTFPPSTMLATNRLASKLAVIASIAQHSKWLISEISALRRGSMGDGFQCSWRCMLNFGSKGDWGSSSIAECVGCVWGAFFFFLLNAR
jgi:hypothetical protein